MIVGKSDEQEKKGNPKEIVMKDFEEISNNETPSDPTIIKPVVLLPYETLEQYLEALANFHIFVFSIFDTKLKKEVKNDGISNAKKDFEIYSKKIETFIELYFLSIGNFTNAIRQFKTEHLEESKEQIFNKVTNIKAEIERLGNENKKLSGNIQAVEQLILGLSDVQKIGVVLKQLDEKNKELDQIEEKAKLFSDSVKKLREVFNGQKLDEQLDEIASPVEKAYFKLSVWQERVSGFEFEWQDLNGEIEEKEWQKERFSQLREKFKSACEMLEKNLAPYMDSQQKKDFKNHVQALFNQKSSVAALKDQKIKDNRKEMEICGALFLETVTVDHKVQDTSDSFEIKELTNKKEDLSKKIQEIRQNINTKKDYFEKLQKVQIPFDKANGEYLKAKKALDEYIEVIKSDKEKFEERPDIVASLVEAMAKLYLAKIELDAVRDPSKEFSSQKRAFDDFLRNAVQLKNGLQFSRLYEESASQHFKEFIHLSNSIAEGVKRQFDIAKERRSLNSRLQASKIVYAHQLNQLEQKLHQAQKEATEPFSEDWIKKNNKELADLKKKGEKVILLQVELDKLQASKSDQAKLPDFSDETSFGNREVSQFPASFSKTSALFSEIKAKCETLEKEFTELDKELRKAEEIRKLTEEERVRREKKESEEKARQEEKEREEEAKKAKEEEKQKKEAELKTCLGEAKETWEKCAKQMELFPSSLEITPRQLEKSFELAFKAALSFEMAFIENSEENGENIDLAKQKEKLEGILKKINEDSSFDSIMNDLFEIKQEVEQEQAKVSERFIDLVDNYFLMGNTLRESISCRQNKENFAGVKNAENRDKNIGLLQASIKFLIENEKTDKLIELFQGSLDGYLSSRGQANVRQSWITNTVRNTSLTALKKKLGENFKAFLTQEIMSITPQNADSVSEAIAFEFEAMKGKHAILEHLAVWCDKKGKSGLFKHAEFNRFLQEKGIDVSESLWSEDTWAKFDEMLLEHYEKNKQAIDAQPIGKNSGFNKTLLEIEKGLEELSYSKERSAIYSQNNG